MKKRKKQPKPAQKKAIKLAENASNVSQIIAHGIFRVALTVGEIVMLIAMICHH